MTEYQLQAMSRTGETGEIVFRSAAGGEVRLVPAKPTAEMIAAGMKRMFDEKRYSAPWDDVVDLMYRAMLDAAPAEAGAQS